MAVRAKFNGTPWFCIDTDASRENEGSPQRAYWQTGIFANMFDRPFRAEKLIHAWICSDHTVVEKYNKDPLCNFTFTLNGYESLLWLMRSTYDRKGWEVRIPNLPILFVLGEDDPFSEAAKTFAGSMAFEKAWL